MAFIVNTAGQSDEDLTRAFEEMDEPTLLAQQICQSGALDMVRFLLDNGATREVQEDVHASLLRLHRIMNTVAKRRGLTTIMEPLNG